MAIINNAHPGSQINLLCLIYRVLRRSKSGLSVDEITKLCRPDTLLRKQDQKKRFPENLRFWMDPKHQLWKEDEKGVLQLVSVTDSENPTPIEIAKCVRKILLLKPIENLLGDNQYDTESLFRPLACFLLSGDFTFATSKVLDRKTLDQFIAVFLSDYNLNDSEKTTFLEYGHFLGYFEAVEKGYKIDPTRAILDCLNEIFNQTNKLSINEFISQLSVINPVLDSGDYQLQIKGLLVNNSWNERKENEISQALSHALYRISVENIIRLEPTSDDKNAMKLDLPREGKLISNVIYQGGSHGVA